MLIQLALISYQITLLKSSDVIWDNAKGPQAMINKL